MFKPFQILCRCISRTWWRSLLLGILACIWVTACTGRDSLQSSADQPASGDCRTIQHQLGETCVPVDPQRVIAVDETTLEVLLALDVKPIASGEPNLVGSRSRHLAGKAEGIASLGKEEQLNLEKMVELKPDLIVGFPIFPEQYPLFSQIAPTVSFDYTHIGWKDELRQVGELLGKTQKAEQLLTQYQTRIAEFQAAMGDRLQQTEVSVIRFYAGYQTSEFRTTSSFPGSVLEDAGLPRPPLQNQPTQPGETYVEVGLERLDLLDGDVIFAAVDPGGEESLKSFQTRPLWQTLKAAQQDQVYTVDSGYWIFGNILAANAILDDLFKYLVEEVS
ncbi:iron-siderophore ABC transporter substrate-binding protein [Egbenema bharatensis]|uniref:iron-siderophore ABC transporter substrate-binding protein n=1 Tax=Egbenema bharatensis TaxID=3463334 RepID=UPI003A8C62E1